RIEFRRLHHEALHLRILRAFHPEVLERRKLMRTQNGVIKMRQRDTRSARRSAAEDLRRLGAALHGVDDILTVVRELHFIQMIVPTDGHAAAAAGYGKILDGLAAAVLRGVEELAGI